MKKRRPHKRMLIFVPEGKRAVTALPVELQDPWVTNLLRLLSRLFGGATAYGRGVGAWREGKSEDAAVHFDRITVIESWIDPRDSKWEDKSRRVWAALLEMCQDLNEQAIGWMVDGVFKEVRRR